MAFHLTLSSQDADPSSSKFRVRLPQSVNLIGEWAVGLHDISIPQSQIAFAADQRLKLLLVRVGSQLGKLGDLTREELYADIVDVHLNSASYTQDDIANWIQSASRRLMSKFQGEEGHVLHKILENTTKTSMYVTVNKTDSNRLTIEPAFYMFQQGETFVRNWIFPILPAELASICGYTELQDTLTHGDIAALTALCTPHKDTFPLRCKPMKLYPLTLYIGCDIIEPSMVGPKFMKILRSLPYPRHSLVGSQAQATFDNPMMLRVVKKEFDTVEIDIKDERGRNLSFESGYSTVTLWFVRK